MNQAVWASCTDPGLMLECLQETGGLTERKARLFVAAVCRRIWPLLTDRRLTEAVEVAERFADGQANHRQRREAYAAAIAAAGPVVASVAYAIVLYAGPIARCSAAKDITKQLTLD